MARVQMYQCDGCPVQANAEHLPPTWLQVDMPVTPPQPNQPSHNRKHFHVKQCLISYLNQNP